MKTSAVMGIVAFGSTLGLSGASMAQTAKDLVGTWQMASNTNTSADGRKTEVFGPKGAGVAIFAANGRFAIVNINPETPKFSADNRAKGTAEENLAAVKGGIGLFGTYKVNGKTIEMKIDGSTYPNWTGTTQKRDVASWTKDEVKWTLAGSVGGTSEVTWKRIK